MKLLDSKEGCSQTASRGSGAGVHAHAQSSEQEAVGAEGYAEGEEEEGDDGEDENGENMEALSNETLKGVRRHSITYWQKR